MKTTLLLLILCIFLLSCETEVVPPPPPPPDPGPTIGLAVEDTGVTEIWLRVSMSQTAWERGFTLVRDGLPIDTAVLLTADSVFVDEGLLPNQQYTYQAFRISDSEILDSTEMVQATTMDTTSHEFTWEIFEFGDHSSSVLLDVAIIDENNIWAVGEIYLNDSTGNPEVDSYNAGHWNGQAWEVIRVPVQVCGTPAIGSPILYSVFGLARDSIMFTEGGNLVIWDGMGFEQRCLPNGLILGTLRQIWTERTNSVYMVGERGTIVHYDGASWQRIESGTDVNINDVWGARDVVSGETTIYAAATNFGSFDERLLLQIYQDGTTSSLSWGPQRSLETVWFVSPEKVFVAGGGVFVGKPGEWTEVPEVSTYYTERLRGSGRNNAFVVGHFGLVSHFNGLSWRYYPEFYANGIYYSVDVTDNFVIAVGQIGSRAVILRGSRQ